MEIISSYGVGYDNVDVREAAQRGIVVTNTPDVRLAELEWILMKASAFLA